MPPPSTMRGRSVSMPPPAYGRGPATGQPMATGVHRQRAVTPPPRASPRSAASSRPTPPHNMVTGYRNSIHYIVPKVYTPLPLRTGLPGRTPEGSNAPSAATSPRRRLMAPGSPPRMRRPPQPYDLADVTDLATARKLVGNSRRGSNEARQRPTEPRRSSDAAGADWASSVIDGHMRGRSDQAAAPQVSLARVDCAAVPET